MLPGTDPSCATAGPNTLETGVAGLVGGFVSVAVTYPIHKIMFRQMLDGVTTSTSISQLRSEGIAFLFRGIGPPLYLKSISTGLMFGSQGHYARSFKEWLPHIQNAHLASACAGCYEATFCAPFERVQTLLMDKKFHGHPKLGKTTVRAFLYLYRSYGFKELYRGGTTIYFRNSFGTVLYFGAREKATKILPPVPPNMALEKYGRDFAMGGVIGATISSIYYPVNVVKSRMQSVMGGTFSSAFGVLGSVYRERGGIVPLFRGVHLNYVRSFFSWAIITATTELVQQTLRKRRCPDD